ncbi:MAG: C4-type zinc ribbon domain-containing protein [Treponema sp.]|nr:C4-type zinc ribbon domain-containing protein [Treponema sp.]
MIMDTIFENLRALQDILSQKITLEHDIQETPKILNAQEELLARLKKTFIETNQEYERARLAEAEYRSLLMEAEHSREHAEKNMDSINTQREYEALDKEIRDASDKEQQYRKELQNQERNLLDLDEQMRHTAALIQQQEAELAERRASIEAEIAEKKALVEQLVEEEQAVTPDIDAEILFKFERIIRNKMGRGIVAIKGGVCMGCHMILPAQFANTVRQGEEIVFCPYCSRILFYEESEQGEEDFFALEDAGSLADLDDMEDDDYEEEDEEEEEKINIDYDD